AAGGRRPFSIPYCTKNMPASASETAETTKTQLALIQSPSAETRGSGGAAGGRFVHGPSSGAAGSGGASAATGSVCAAGAGRGWGGTASGAAGSAAGGADWARSARARSPTARSRSAVSRSRLATRAFSRPTETRSTTTAIGVATTTSAAITPRSSQPSIVPSPAPVFPAVTGTIHSASRPARKSGFPVVVAGAAGTEKPGQRAAHETGDARLRQRREGQGPADLDRGHAHPGGQRAVHNPLAEPPRQLREEAAARDRLDQVVTHRHRAGGDEMGEHRAQEPPAADGTGTAAVDLGDATDHPEVHRQRRRHVRQGERHEGRHRRHLPRRRL